MVNEMLVEDRIFPCPYRTGQLARWPLYHQRRVLTGLEADARFARNERRTGFHLYRTDCPVCRACQGIRLPVAAFVPSRSQRRVIKRWAALGDRFRWVLGKPQICAKRLALFNRHRLARGLQDGHPLSAQSYINWFIKSCFETIEMRYIVDRQLVGVGIVDLGQRSSSSVYFYFDPDWSNYSPGVYSVLREVDWCLATGRSHHYLGFYVSDCRSLNYKANYRPHERWVGGNQWVRSTAPFEG